MTDLRREGDVVVLTLSEGDDRLHPDVLDGLDDALAAVEATARAGAPCALVTTGTGRLYSNGLDLDWLGDHPDRSRAYLARVHGLLARLLRLPAPSVAAVNGHVYAAGLMMALAHDHRVMRVDRGYACLPEVDLGLPFTPAMSALLRARLPTPVAHEAMVLGRRYGGDAAEAAGIVDRAVADDRVLPTALELAASLAPKAGPTIAAIRSRLYGEVLAVLDGD